MNLEEIKEVSRLLMRANEANPDFLLADKHDRGGGLCRSIIQDGFTFDYAGHILFTPDKYVDSLFREVLQENFHEQQRQSHETKQQQVSNSGPSTVGTKRTMSRQNAKARTSQMIQDIRLQTLACG